MTAPIIPRHRDAAVRKLQSKAPVKNSRVRPIPLSKKAIVKTTPLPNSREPSLLDRFRDAIPENKREWNESMTRLRKQLGILPKDDPYRT